MPNASQRAPMPLRMGPLDTILGFFLRLAQVAVYQDFFRAAPALLTPSQLAVLILIKHNPDRMQQDLCEGIGIDKSTFSGMLDALAERKLIVALRSKEDRRRKTMRLTPKGESALRGMLAHVARHERRVFARLSRGERTQLMKLLKKVGDPTTGL